MIFLWATAAMTICIVMARKYKIPYIHYLWVLLPIDQYGVTILGSVIKPYMIFGLALLAIAIQRRSLKLNRTQIAFALFFIIAFSISDSANGFIISSAMQRIYFFVILIEAWIYASLLNDTSDFSYISKSIVISSVGFGLINIIADVCFKLNVALPGIVSDTSKSGALIKRYTTMANGELVVSYRLHGFENDPNGFTIFFIAGLITSLYLLLIKKDSKVLNCIGVLVAITNILASGSRSALLVSVIGFTLIMIKKISTLQRTSQVLTTFVLSTAVIIFIFVGFENIENFIRIIPNAYGRSGLYDKYGRFTIWKENLNILLEKSPFYGLGSNMVKNYSSIGRACHNTWLEWICSVGIIFGPIAILIFANPLKYIFTKKGQSEKIECLALIYLCLFLMLTTVDYFSNTYFIIIYILIYRLVHLQKIKNSTL